MLQETTVTIFVGGVAIAWCCWVIRDTIRYYLLHDRIVQLACIATNEDDMYGDNYNRNERAWRQLIEECKVVRELDPNTLFGE